MPPIIWPETLPASPLLDGFREHMPQLALRTEMDQGPAKIRRRHTAGVGKISMSYLLSAAQVSALAGFFIEDTAGGTLSFSLPHPRTGETVTCRFRQPPEYLPVNGGFFRAGVELETLP